MQQADAQKENFPLTEIGVVVIGRNEGDRLDRSLSSVLENGSQVVYVDSGSTDQSLEIAQSLAVETVALDSARPFTAARARNAGFRYLTSTHPSLEFIQFVDGDCEIASGWIHAAAKYMASHPEVGVVCGELTERDAKSSIYKRLCAMEWKGPIGWINKTGGNALVRAHALKIEGGYDEQLVAGEEAEMCARLRGAGWEICRIAHAMAVHDADIDSFGQWWRRSVRSGYAYTVGVDYHRPLRHRHQVREATSILVWAGVLPLFIALLAWPTNGLSLLLLGLYGLLWCRIAWTRRRQDDMAGDAAIYATFCVIAKFAQLIGSVIYLCGRLTGRSTGLIQTKAGHQELP